LTAGYGASIAAACRDIRGHEVRGRGRLAWVSQAFADVELAWRGFRRHPGFAAASLLTLTLGIGAAATVVTIANGVLLRPLPYHDPSQLAMQWLTTPASRSAAISAVITATGLPLRGGARHASATCPV
jgi:hypothetical protein